MDSQSGSISSSISAFFGEQPQLQEILFSSSGGTSVTYRILKENKYYFIKQLKPEYAGKSSYENMFHKEYEVGKTLSSKYFPRYLDFMEEDGIPAILMEYVEGLPLNKFIEQHPKYFISRRNLKRFLTQLLYALSELHTHQIVHLDIKPENILITTVNNDVRVIDLGFCYTDSMPFTQGRTDSFAAPEQFHPGQSVDTRTDIFAVGKIIEYILDKTGSESRMYRNISKHCCDPNPVKRYQTETELLRELNHFIIRNRLIFLISIILAILVIACSFFYYHLNNYDFATDGKGAPDKQYFRLIDNDNHAEITYKFDWGNSYQHDLAISSCIEYEGQRYTVTSIGDSAFRESPLEAITIPSSIKSIKSWAFDKCSNLAIVNIPDGVEKLGLGSFAGCKKLRTIRLSTSLREIPRSCFVDCGIEEIYIPEGVEIIRQDAFVGNDNLKKVHLPSTLKTLDRGVFYHCYKLEQIEIPASVTSIGDFLLWECPNLKIIYDYAEKPQTCTGIVKKGFKGVIYVPKKSVEAYRKAQGWSGLNIKSIPFCS